MGICYIVGASDFDGVHCLPKDGDFVIAADRGYLSAGSLGITPDLILGDFDSLGEIPSGENVRVYPVEKDDTDIGIAIAEGLSRGYREFHIYGGLGGTRPDHSFANYQHLLRLSRDGVRAVLFGKTQNVTAITDSSCTLSGECGALFSVFAFGTATVSIEGASYPLQNAILKETFPLGVSNSLKDSSVTVSAKGSVLIFFKKTLKFT
jgi:thiamine pyrophosphokinase